MRRLLLALTLLGCLAFPAHAQIDRSASEAIANDLEARMNAPQNPALVPVETMTCEQMGPEMMAAGQQMSAQLDPSFAGNVQSYHDDVQRRQAGAMAGGVATGIGTGLMCSIPGIGMACGAMMQAQMANQMRQAQADQQRMDVILGQVNESTQGLDLARMQALSERWEAQGCEMPEGARE